VSFGVILWKAGGVDALEAWIQKVVFRRFQQVTS